MPSSHRIERDFFGRKAHRQYCVNAFRPPDHGLEQRLPDVAIQLCRRDRTEHALLAKRVRESVTLVTALNPIIGYEMAALIAKTAIKTGQPIDEFVESLGITTRQQMEELLPPEKLTQLLRP